MSPYVLLGGFLGESVRTREIRNFCTIGEKRWFMLMLLWFAILEVLPLDVESIRLDDIYWNSSNPIFRIDNTDHIIDVNKANIPFEYDQVNVICPVYPPGSSDEEAEKYIIYNVSKEEYESCSVTDPNPRVIAVCDKPNRVMYFTITFRSFTPQPGGLEFKPGQDYYFISTSSADNLYSRIGGRCFTHNMRIIFKVCCDPAKVTSTQYVAPPTSTVQSTSTHSTSTRLVQPTTSTDKKIIYKGRDRTATKQEKTPRPDSKHPNETGEKNEELVNSMARTLAPCWVTWVVTSCAVLLMTWTHGTTVSFR